VPAMPTRILRLTLHCSIGVAIVACSEDSTAIPCTMNDQCASHFCQADDTCAPVPTIDAGTMVANDGGTDGGSANELCTPNHDGMIVQSELPLAAGRTANFLVASGSNVTWDTTGSAGSGNMRTWDLSGALSGDTQEPIMLASPSGTWWGSDFSDVTYASILSTTDPTLLGVFHVDSNQVTLLGVVSTSGGPTETELKYNPPAKILALPFMAASTWTSTSTVSGTADGLAVLDYTEEYDSTVDQVGTMKTPYSTVPFPVLRVATNLIRDDIGYSRTFAWVAECFGSVAQVQSQAYPSQVPTGEFDNPAEVWRITP
jgi:hypothetical protein